MTWEIIGQDRQTTSRWSGGRTTQLYIHPRDGSYADRRFHFRISSAVVELDRSEFTPLPGFQRHIMPLEGRMILHHEGRHKAELEPFQVDVFSGGWRTCSFGRCVDFNLMCGKGWQGSLSRLSLPGRLICGPGGFAGLYALAGCRVRLSREGGPPEALTMARGDFLMVRTGPEDGPVELAVQGEVGDPPPVLTTCRPA